MITTRTMTLTCLALAATLAGCGPKEKSAPDDQAATTQKADATESVAAAPKPADGGAPALKGLDPTPPLNRIDLGSGVVLEDLKMGTGDIVWPASRVKVNLRGWSIALGKMYWDPATQTPTKETVLALSDPKTMKGMREGIPGMRVGGKRRMTLAPDKAYGFKDMVSDSGEVVVPALTPIVLEIEVLEVLSKLRIETPVAEASPAEAKTDTGAAAPAPNK